jgi:hypothetical protein
VDVGGAGVSSAGAPAAGSVSLTPLVEWTDAAAYAVVSGSVAALGGGDWTAQSWADVSLLGAPAGPASPLRLELAASAGGTAHSGGYRTGLVRVEPRVHLAARGAGGWIGAAAAAGGATERRGTGTVGPTVGGWLRQRAWTATAIWSPFRLEGRWVQELAGRLAWAAGPLDALAYAGWRDAPSGAGIEEATWGGATVACWVSSHVAVVAAGGSYAPDLLQGLARGRYLSVAVRLARERPTAWTPSWTGRPVYAIEAGRPGTGNSARGVLRFVVAGATRVDLAGDWTGWRPVPLERAADGAWVLRVTLPPGAYRFNLIVNGKRWIVPDGVAAVDDGLGGRAGILVVP